MSKIKKKKYSAPIPKQNVPPKQNENSSSMWTNFWPNYGYLLFIGLYLLVDVVPPKIGILDYYIQHRLYVDIINLGAAFYIFKYFTSKYGFHISKFFKNAIPIAYTIFIILSTLSLIVAFSKIEGILELSRYYSNYFAFLNIFVLLYKGKQNFKLVAALMTITLFYQVASDLYTFTSSLGQKPLWQVINDFKWTTGNKNIFAATILFKLPFVFYSALRGITWVKILSYITIVLAFFSIFYISARAAYFSLLGVTLISVLGTLVAYLRNAEWKKTAIINSVGLLLALGISFYWSDKVLTKYLALNIEQTNTDSPSNPASFQDILKNTATTSSPSQSDSVSLETAEVSESFVAGRVDAALALNDIRFSYWESILKGVSDKPFLGIGIGNYKIYSPKFIDPVVSSPLVNKYAHNDFIEIIAQSGWITAFAYLSLFILATFFALKVFFSKRSSDERKYVSAILLAALFAFFVDSFFNFPLGRTNTNIYFIIILSFIIINYLGIKETRNSDEENKSYAPFRIVVLGFMAIGLVCLYISYSNYISSADQYLIEADFQSKNQNGKALKYTSDQAAKLLDHTFPVLGEFGESLTLKKAKYLYFENKNEEALKLLDQADKETPFHIADEVYKVVIYSNNLKKIDSAAKYSKLVFKQRPYSVSDFNNYLTLMGQTKDIKALQEGFKIYSKYHEAEATYVKYIDALVAARYDFVKDKSLIEAGLKKYPKNARLIELKNFFDLISQPQHQLSRDNYFKGK